MKSVYTVKFSWSGLLYPLLFVFMIWTVYWVEIKFNFYFNEFGVVPRSVSGLKGVFFSPFIHSGIEHLASNSVPLFVLSVALFYFYNPIAWRVLFVGLILSGIFTWLIGRPSTHIGASGIIYLLVSFLFFKGIWSKNYRLIAVSLVVVFLYGSMIWGIFPQEPKISWEGHFSGLVAGVIIAIYYHNYQIELFDSRLIQPKQNEVDDAFLQQFDENGNFIPASELDDDRDFSKNISHPTITDVSYENESNSIKK